MHGQTALHVAASANDYQMVKFYIVVDHLGLRRERGCSQRTQLHSTSCGTHKGIETMCPFAVDDDGNSAFHIAAEMAKMVRENINWIVIMLRQSDAATELKNHSGKTLRDLLEALPREWISEDLMDALGEKDIQLSPTVFEVGDWVKFRRTINMPHFGWGGAKPWSVGFVQNIIDGNTLLVSSCSGEARALVEEVVKVIPLDRGQSVWVARAVP